MTFPRLNEEKSTSIPIDRPPPTVVMPIILPNSTRPYLKTGSGIITCFQLILGLACIGIVLNDCVQYSNSLVAADIVFTTVVVTLTIITLVQFIFAMLNGVTGSRKPFITCNAVAFAVLAVMSVYQLVRMQDFSVAVEWFRSDALLAASIMSLVNAILYLTNAAVTSVSQPI